MPFGRCTQLRTVPHSEEKRNVLGESTEIVDRRKGRRRDSQRAGACGHTPPIVVHKVAAGSVALCLKCGAEGPVRDTPLGARFALSVEPKPTSRELDE
jgi:hypothetical protein